MGKYTFSIEDGYGNDNFTVTMKVDDETAIRIRQAILGILAEGDIKDD